MAADFPLTALEAPSAWKAHEHEIRPMIIAEIEAMGLSNARKRVCTDYVSRIGSGPDDDYVRETLKVDVVLADTIHTRVERDFWVGIDRGQIERSKVGGWLYRVTCRATWRLATERAVQLFAHVYETKAWDDAGANLPSDDNAADQALERAELLAITARYCAELTPDEHELLDLGDEPRDYGRLSDRLGVSIEALRVRAHRLLERLRRRLVADLADPEILAL